MVENEIVEQGRKLIDSIYARCKNEMPKDGKEGRLLRELGMYSGQEIDGEYEGNELSKFMFDLFDVPDCKPYLSAYETLTAVHCSESWQRNRLLINRILGKMKRMNSYPIGADHISLAMDNRKIKKLWKDVYDSQTVMSLMPQLSGGCSLQFTTLSSSMVEGVFGVETLQERSLANVSNTELCSMTTESMPTRTSCILGCMGGGRSSGNEFRDLRLLIPKNDTP